MEWSSHKVTPFGSDSKLTSTLWGISAVPGESACTGCIEVFWMKKLGTPAAHSFSPLWFKRIPSALGSHQSHYCDTKSQSSFLAVYSLFEGSKWAQNPCLVSCVNQHNSCESKPGAMHRDCLRCNATCIPPTYFSCARLRNSLYSPICNCTILRKQTTSTGWLWLSSPHGCANYQAGHPSSNTKVTIKKQNTPSKISVWRSSPGIPPKVLTMNTSWWRPDILVGTFEGDS